MRRAPSAEASRLALASRERERAEGLAFVRAWRARRYAVAAAGRFPYTHRTCGQWGGDD